MPACRSWAASGNFGWCPALPFLGAPAQGGPVTPPSVCSFQDGNCAACHAWGHSPPRLLRVLLLCVGFQSGIDLLPQRFHFRGAGQTLGIWTRERIQVGKKSLQRRPFYHIHGWERTQALFNHALRDWDKSVCSPDAHCHSTPACDLPWP